MTTRLNLERQHVDEVQFGGVSNMAQVIIFNRGTSGNASCAPSVRSSKKRTK